MAGRGIRQATREVPLRDWRRAAGRASRFAAWNLLAPLREPGCRNQSECSCHSVDIAKTADPGLAFTGVIGCSEPQTIAFCLDSVVHSSSTSSMVAVATAAN